MSILTLENDIKCHYKTNHNIKYGEYQRLMYICTNYANYIDYQSVSEYTSIGEKYLKYIYQLIKLLPDNVYIISIDDEPTPMLTTYLKLVRTLQWPTNQLLVIISLHIEYLFNYYYLIYKGPPMDLVTLNTHVKKHIQNPSDCSTFVGKTSISFDMYIRDKYYYNIVLIPNIFQVSSNNMWNYFKRAYDASLSDTLDSVVSLQGAGNFIDKVIIPIYQTKAHHTDIVPISKERSGSTERRREKRSGSTERSVSRPRRRERSVSRHSHRERSVSRPRRRERSVSRHSHRERSVSRPRRRERSVSTERRREKRSISRHSHRHSRKDKYEEMIQGYEERQEQKRRRYQERQRERKNRLKRHGRSQESISVSRERCVKRCAKSTPIDISKSDDGQDEHVPTPKPRQVSEDITIVAPYPPQLTHSIWNRIGGNPAIVIHRRIVRCDISYTTNNRNQS